METENGANRRVGRARLQSAPPESGVAQNEMVEAIMFGDKDTTTRIQAEDLRLAGRFHEGAPCPNHARAEEPAPFYASESCRTVRWAIGDEIDGMLQALQSF